MNLGSSGASHIGQLFRFEDRVLVQAQGGFRALVQFGQGLFVGDAVFDGAGVGSRRIILDDFFPDILAAALRAFLEKLLGLFDGAAADAEGCRGGVGFDVVEAGEGGAVGVDVHFRDAGDAIDDILVAAHGDDGAQGDGVGAAREIAAPHEDVGGRGGGTRRAGGCGRRVLGGLLGVEQRSGEAKKKDGEEFHAFEFARWMRNFQH